MSFLREQVEWAMTHLVLVYEKFVLGAIHVYPCLILYDFDRHSIRIQQERKITIDLLFALLFLFVALFSRPLGLPPGSIELDNR